MTLAAPGAATRVAPSPGPSSSGSGARTLSRVGLALPVLVILLIKADMPMKSIVGLVRVLRMHWINDLTRSGAHARTEEISRGEV